MAAAAVKIAAAIPIILKIDGIRPAADTEVCEYAS